MEKTPLVLLYGGSRKDCDRLLDELELHGITGGGAGEDDDSCVLVPTAQFTDACLAMESLTSGGELEPDSLPAAEEVSTMMGDGDGTH